MLKKIINYLRAIYWNKATLFSYTVFFLYYFFAIFDLPDIIFGFLGEFMIIIIIPVMFATAGLWLTNFGYGTYVTYNDAIKYLERKGLPRDKLIKRAYPNYCSKQGYQMALTEYTRCNNI